MVCLSMLRIQSSVSIPEALLGKTMRPLVSSSLSIAFRMVLLKESRHVIKEGDPLPATEIIRWKESWMVIGSP